MDTHIYIAESLCCSLKTITTLLIIYTPKQNKLKKITKKGVRFKLKKKNSNNIGACNNRTESPSLPSPRVFYPGRASEHCLWCRLPDLSAQTESHALSKPGLHELSFSTHCPVPLIYHGGPSLLEYTYLSPSFHRGLLPVILLHESVLYPLFNHLFLGRHLDCFQFLLSLAPPPPPPPPFYYSYELL